MIAQTKCTYANLYLDSGGTLIKTKYKFLRKANIGRLTGRSTIYNHREYVEIDNINGLAGNYLVKKVAVNIIEEEEENDKGLTNTPVITPVITPQNPTPVITPQNPTDINTPTPKPQQTPVMRKNTTSLLLGLAALFLID